MTLKLRLPFDEMSVPAVVFLSLGMLLLLVQGQSIEIFRLRYNITEEEVPGIFVGNTALDTKLFSSSTSENFQLLKFEMFESGNPYAEYFSVDGQNGVIRTKKRIDREYLCRSQKECILTIVIAVYRKTSDTGNFDLYKTIQVNISVDDMNDNSPEFTQAVVTLTIPENTRPPYSLYTSAASDADSLGPNSALNYSLGNSMSVFSLAPQDRSLNVVSDLELIVNEMLDREVKDSYFLTITAYDGGTPRHSGSVLINIDVTDINDNKPVFSRSNYSTSIAENASINDTILTVLATDLDSGDNGRVEYQINARTGQEIKDTFRIGRNDGKVYLSRPVDYETATKFQFFIEALDRGSPILSSSALVVINIVDVNDNAPQIILNLSPEGTDIVENDPPGKYLGYITVSDADSGLNGVVLCDIDDRSFRLEVFDNQTRNVFKIMLSQSLDREVSAFRNVVIECKDGVINPLLATQKFTVRVLDVNDNAPNFTLAEFNGAVLENRPSNTFVLQRSADDVSSTRDILRINATDPDDGNNGRVVYSLSPNSNFSVDADTGTIKTTMTFDRERQSVYRFQVYAHDSGSRELSASADVVVIIMDQNDSPPRFPRPIFFLYFEENLPPNTLVGTITAFDDDTGSNARMKYSIVQDNNSSLYFSINSDTGEITSARSFDREARGSYRLSVEVHDPDISNYKDSAIALVTITDVNDNAPEFVYPSITDNSVTLPNNSTTGTVIITVKCQDADDPNATNFSYRIQNGNPDGLFEILNPTGKVILARKITPENAILHTLTIVVKDNETNPRYATATLLITIPSAGLSSNASLSFLQEPNFLIVIIIICVTLFIALLIVVAICIICRRDRKSRARRQRQVKDKLYQSPHWVQSIPLSDTSGSSIAHETSRSSDGMEEGRKGRKEVSFSLDDGLQRDGEGDADLSGSSGSIFLSPSTPNQDNNNLKPPRDGRLTFVSGKSLPSSQSTSCYESCDSHMYQNAHAPLTELERHGEDALSQSSGETGTDSGRGNSEDEAHINRGSSIETDNSPRNFNRQQSGSSSGFSSFNSCDRMNLKPSSLSSLPEEHPRRFLYHQQLPLPPPQQHQQQPVLYQNVNQVDSYRPLLPNHNYIRSSTDSLPTHGLGYPAGCSQSTKTFDRDNYLTIDGKKSDGPFRIRDAPQTRRTFQTFGPQHQQSHPAWRQAKGLDGSRRSVTPTTSYPTTDDDDVTTTSGSYTVSPDEQKADVTFHPARDIMV